MTRKTVFIVVLVLVVLALVYGWQSGLIVEFSNFFAAQPDHLTIVCGATQNVLTWTYNDFANSNSIQRGNNGAKNLPDCADYWCWLPTINFPHALPTVGNPSTYTDTQLQSGVCYAYRIKYQPQLPSNEVFCPVNCNLPFPTPTTPTPTTPPPTPTPSAAPVTALLAAVCDTPDITRVSVSWSMTSGIQTMNVLERQDDNGLFTVIFQEQGPPFLRHSYADTQIVFGHTYRYRVMVGAGAYSNTVTVVANAQTCNAVTPTPTPSPTPLPTQNNTICVSHTIPSIMTGGQVVAVAVTFQNTGTSTWVPTNWPNAGSYGVTFWPWGSDIPPFDPRSGAVQANSVAPGQNAVFNFNLKAPAVPGTYKGIQYRMVHEGVEYFGDACGPNTITVTAPPTPTQASPPTTSTPPPTTITPPPGVAALAIQKSVRNLTQGGSAGAQVAASPGESIEFILRVQSTGAATALAVTLRDALPAGLTYQAGSTTVDGAPAADGIPGAGLSLGDMIAGRSVFVGFRATVAGASFFSPGVTVLRNVATAAASGISASVFTSVTGTAQVRVSLTVTGPITQVPTGPGESAVLALIVSTIVTLLYVGYTATDAFRRHEATTLARGSRDDTPDFKR